MVGVRRSPDPLTGCPVEKPLAFLRRPVIFRHPPPWSRSSSPSFPFPLPSPILPPSSFSFHSSLPPSSLHPSLLPPALGGWGRMTCVSSFGSDLAIFNIIPVQNGMHARGEMQVVHRAACVSSCTSHGAVVAGRPFRGSAPAASALGEGSVRMRQAGEPRRFGLGVAGRLWKRRAGRHFSRQPTSVVL